MKKFLKSKVTMVTLACLLLVGVFAGISVLANNAPTLEITQVNIKHDGQAKIAYTVKAGGANVEEENMKLYLWGRYPDTDAKLADPDAVSSVSYNTANDGTYVAYSRGFAPAEMTQLVFAQVVYVVDGEVKSKSNIVRYSVFEYICDVTYDNSASSEDKAFYSAMQDYLTYAQKYLGWTENSSPEQLGYVTVTGGYILPNDNSDNRYTHGVYLADKGITICANCDESEFAYWFRGDNGDQYIGKTWSYSLGVAAETHRNYSAVAKSYLTLSVDGADAAAVTVKYTNDNKTYVDVTYQNNRYSVNSRYVELTANDQIGNAVFEGWYVGDTLVSEELTYTFNPHINENGKETGAQSHTLAAKYVDRETMYWNELKDAGCPDETIAALKNLNDFFNGPAIIDWMANLWDPEAGGFYYSNSARDYEGFKADIESTYQVINWLSSNGALGSLSKNEFFPNWMKEDMVNFAKSLQSSTDGYFYHPQWGSNVNVDRYGRDLTWAITIIRDLDPYGVHQYPNYCAPNNGMKCALHKDGGSCAFPISSSNTLTVCVFSDSALTADLTEGVLSAVHKVQKANTAVIAAESVSSKPDYSSSEAFTDWLYAYNEVPAPGEYNSAAIEASDLMPSSGKAHHINALKNDIKGRYADELLDFLDEMQARTWNYQTQKGQTPTGVWQTSIDQEAVWGVHKYMEIYNEFGRAINHEYAPKMIETCKTVILQGYDSSWEINDMMNQWSGIRAIISNLSTYNLDCVANARTSVRTDAVELIEKTMENLEHYKLSDPTVGSFGYSAGTPPHSLISIYGTPISLGLAESDVNTNLLVCGLYSSVFSVLDYGSVPLCTADNGQRFLAIVQDIQNGVIKYDKSPVPEDYNFDGYTDVDEVVGLTPAMVSEGSEVEVVTDPYNTGRGNVLAFTSQVSTTSNNRVSFKTKTDSAHNCYVFETDIALDATCDSSTLTNECYELFQIDIGGIYMLSIGHNGNQMYLNWRKDTGSINSSQTVHSFTYSKGTWISLKLVLYVVDGELTVDYYVNNQKVATDVGHNKGEALSTAYDSVTFRPRMPYDTKIYLDNCAFYTTTSQTDE